MKKVTLNRWVTLISLTTLIYSILYGSGCGSHNNFNLSAVCLPIIFSQLSLLLIILNKLLFTVYRV
jgi:hypothetical protein